MYAVCDFMVAEPFNNSSFCIAVRSATPPIVRSSSRTNAVRTEHMHMGYMYICTRIYAPCKWLCSTNSMYLRRNAWAGEMESDKIIGYMSARHYLTARVVLMPERTWAGAVAREKCVISFLFIYLVFCKNTFNAITWMRFVLCKVMHLYYCPGSLYKAHCIGCIYCILYIAYIVWVVC